MQMLRSEYDVRLFLASLKESVDDLIQAVARLYIDGLRANISPGNMVLCFDHRPCIGKPEDTEVSVHACAEMHPAFGFRPNHGFVWLVKLVHGDHPQKAVLPTELCNELAQDYLRGLDDQTAEALASDTEL